VKAWTVSSDEQSLVLAADMPLNGRGMNMQVITESFILIGLDNGSLAGWNLQDNLINYLPVAPN
jgi:hypothetical protein